MIMCVVRGMEVALEVAACCATRACSSNECGDEGRMPMLIPGAGKNPATGSAVDGANVYKLPASAGVGSVEGNNGVAGSPIITSESVEDGVGEGGGEGPLVKSIIFDLWGMRIAGIGGTLPLAGKGRVYTGVLVRIWIWV